MKFCAWCGKQIEDGDVFCGYCGRRADGSDAAAQQPRPTPQQPTPQQPQQAQVKSSLKQVLDGSSPLPEQHDN